MNNPRMRECEECGAWVDWSELTKGLCKYCCGYEPTPKDVMDYYHDHDHEETNGVRIGVILEIR